MAFLVISAVFLLGITWLVIRGIRRSQRERFIESYQFPQKLNKELLRRYGHLSNRDAEAVVDGLRCYFHLCGTARKRNVAMPSQAVDVVWHEFILFTKEYQIFCKNAFGRFLHHVPAEAMPSKTEANEGIRTSWRLACLRELINPKSPERLPTLFALDARLDIKDGFHYSLDCTKTKGKDFCATHIACTSSCSGGCASDSSDDSGCGSSCSSCGGGD